LVRGAPPGRTMAVVAVRWGKHRDSRAGGVFQADRVGGYRVDRL